MTDSRVTAEWIERDGARWAYMVRPSARRATAAVLTLHEAFGLNTAIQTLCARLAGGDYTVIERRFRELGIRHELVRYSGIRPGFIFPDRDTYAPREAEDAWQRTLAFFETHLRRQGATA